MTLKSQWKILLPALALFALSGCAFLKQFLSSAFKQPGFAFRRVELHDASLSGISLDTIWQMDNPNTVGLSLASVDYALFIDNKQVLAGSPPNGLQIPAQGSAEIVFPTGIKFQDLVEVVATFINKDTATYRAEGSLGVSTPIGVIKIPLATQGDFEVPKLPAISFGNPRIGNVSLSGATFEFPINVNNKNSFPMLVSQVTGALSIGGSNVGTLSTGNLGALDGKGAKTITLPLTVSFLGAAGAVVNAARGGNSSLGFNAQVQSGSVSLPFSLNQAVSFVK